MVSNRATRNNPEIEISNYQFMCKGTAQMSIDPARLYDC